MAPAEETKTTSSIPDGKFKVVSIAMDLTGKKFIDEICCIGAYAPRNKGFVQYVMPNRNVAPSSTRKHGLKIFTQYGRFRVIRDMATGRSLRTKSSYSSLADFITWLEEVKKTGGEWDGIILAYHDSPNDNFTPFLVSELQKYQLMDKFTAVVKGYCNIAKVAAAQEKMKDKILSLQGIVRNLEIPKVAFVTYGQARRRCGLTYRVLNQLVQAEGEVSSSQLLTFCDNQQDIIENWEHKRELSLKIQSLRPIFLPHIRKGQKERQRAVGLRRYLIEIEAEYSVLESAYKSGGSDEIAKLIEKSKASRRKADASELLQYIVDHFSGATAALEKKEGKPTKEMGQGDSGEVNHHDDTDTDDDEFEEAKEDGDQ